MLTEQVLRTTGVPDIAALLGKPPGVPLLHNDFACLLRCYLREVRRTARFLILCGAGYLRDKVTEQLPRGTVLKECPLGVGLPLLPLGNGSTPPPIFIVQLLNTAGLMVLELPVNGQARLDELGEVAYFARMESCGIQPSRALRLVHDTLITAAIAEVPDRVEPIGSRVAAIGDQIAREFEAHRLPW